MLNSIDFDFKNQVLCEQPKITAKKGKKLCQILVIDLCPTGLFQDDHSSDNQLEF
jgi:hypothetical protein